MARRRAKTQAKIALAALAAISLAACGTTVRHHGTAGSISADGAGSGSDSSLNGTSGSGSSDQGSTGSSTDNAAGSGSSATSTDTGTGSGTASSSGTGSGSSTGSSAGTGGTGSSSTGSTGTGSSGTGSTGSSKSNGSTKSSGSSKSSTPAATATKGTDTTTKSKANPTGQATLSPVQVGIVYFTDIGSASVQTGGKAAQTGDEKQDAQSAIDYVNAHGGLYGHTLTPIYYPFQLLSTTPYATAMQSICSNFTQDNHVAIALFVGAAVPNDLASCLSAKGVAYMSDGGYLHDETTFQQITGLLSPSEVTTTEAMKALVANIVSSGWVKSTDKVGVLLGENEDAAVRAYNSQVVPGLKGHVLSVTSYPVDYPSSTQEATTTTANQVQSDQVQMRADGVTKVIMMAPGTLGSFMKDADQQKWDPQYAITSWDTPTGDAGGAVPASQLVNLTGIGWQPVIDIGTYGKTDYDNSTTKLCRTIETPNGQDTGQLSEYAQQVFCTAILEVQAMAMKAQPATVTGGTLVAGYNALGDSFPDSLTMSSNFGPGAGHAGAASYRMFTYQASCDCNVYTTPEAKFS